MMQAAVHNNRQSDGSSVVQLSGVWKVGRPTPSLDEVKKLVEDARTGAIGFDTNALETWDSSLLVYVSALMDHCAASGVRVLPDGLPKGVRRLLSLSGGSTDDKKETRQEPKAPSFLERLGETGFSQARALVSTSDFLGELAVSAVRLATGKARLRWSDLVVLIQACGWQALPIVSLISILVGLILAFMGAVQLKMFGAQIYVADLVGIGMTREMGAVMAGVIMAGRTGAAFAANLGTMKVNEEIDALKTLGVSPMDFLVLPRVVALVIMMPLLCIYADFMGLLGGMVVGVGAFDISLLQYLVQTRNALAFTHIFLGIFKSVVFGLIVAISGCMQGIGCGRSAAAVGQATTSAVVIAIVYIVVADGIFALMANVLGM